MLNRTIYPTDGRNCAPQEQSEGQSHTKPETSLLLWLEARPETDNNECITTPALEDVLLKTLNDRRDS